MASPLSRPPPRLRPRPPSPAVGFLSRLAHVTLTPRQAAVLLLAASLLYLTVELAFSARLLDAAGGRADISQLHGLERWGRTLSGIALGLMLWGAYVGRGRSRRSLRAILLALALVLPPSIALMFQVQSVVVEHEIAQLDARGRRDAAFLANAATAIVRGDLTLTGLELSSAEWATPAGKSFLALFPLMTLHLPDLDVEGQRVLRQALTNQLTVTCRQDGSPHTRHAPCLGSAAQFHNGPWSETIATVNRLWKAYAEGINQYFTVLDRIPGEQQRAWARYAAALEGRGYSPASVPRAAWQRVRDHVRDRLEVPVAASWQPSDRAGFEAAVAARVRQPAEAAYAEAMRNRVGVVLPKTLHSPQELMATPDIQQRVAAGLAATGLGLTFPYVTDPAEVEARVYRPLLAAQVERALQPFEAAVAEFAPGGRHAEQGRQAAERLVVPPLALFFSLLGGLLHLSKVAWLGARLAGPFCRWLPPAAALLVLVLVCLPGAVHHNTVSTNPVFLTLEAGAARQIGPAGAGALRWILQTEHLAYPFNDGLRRHVLGNFAFGFAASP